MCKPLQSRMMTFAVAVAAVVTVAGPGAADTADTADAVPSTILQWQDAEVVALGQGIYAAHCAACHGVELEGEDDWRQRDETGRLPAPPHDETGHTWHHPDAVLVAITLYGTEALVGGDYRSNMMGFGDVLTEAEIIAALSYIKSTWPDEVIEIHNDINARAAAR